MKLARPLLVALLVLGLSAIVSAQALTTISVDIISQEDAGWRPLPNANESLPGNSHRFVVEWFERNAAGENVPSGIQHNLRVLITWVTQIPGVASNYGSRTDADFQILEADNAGWTVVNIAEATTVAAYASGVPVAFQVAAFDGAAEMKIKAQLFDAGPPVGPVLLEGPEHLFPLDNDELNARDHLPNGWESSHGLNPATVHSHSNDFTDDQEDIDASPQVDVTSGRPGEPPGSRTGLGQLGDGLTAWEEYRGFFAKGQFVSPDPQVKDLFVVSEYAAGPGSIARRIFDNVRELSATDRVEIETLGTMVINYNNLTQGHGVTLQRGLRIKLNNSLPDGVAGETPLRVRANTTVRRYIHTGPGGKCDTTAVGDDVQVIRVGYGEPDAPYIAPTRGQLTTEPNNVNAGGDDEIVGGFITTGPKGLADTSPAGNDAYTEPIAPGAGAPNRLCIDPGPDGVLQTAPVGAGQGGDDDYGETSSADAENHLNLTPNETLAVYVSDLQIGRLAGLIASVPKPKQAGLVSLLTEIVLAHEVGHGVHVAHYSPEKNELAKASVMASFVALQGQNFALKYSALPTSYDAVDFGQRRLHLKHR